MVSPLLPIVAAGLVLANTRHHPHPLAVSSLPTRSIHHSITSQRYTGSHQLDTR